MSNATTRRSWRSKMAMSLITGALAVGAFTSAAATASATPAHTQAFDPPASSISTNKGASAIELPTLAPRVQPRAVAITPVNYVIANQVLLRKAPSRTSTKLDVMNYGRGLDVYCWTQDSWNSVWVHAHPWGSRFTGYVYVYGLVHIGRWPPHC